MAAADGHNIEHGVFDDAGRVAYDAGAEVWADRECDIGDRPACEQRELRSLRRGKRRNGRDDARRCHCRRAEWHHHEWSGARVDSDGLVVARRATGGEIHAARTGWHAGRGRRSRLLSCLTRSFLHYWADSGCRWRERSSGNQESLNREYPDARRASSRGAKALGEASADLATI